MELVHGAIELLHAMKDWTEAWAARPTATAALFIISFAESSFFPIPPDALMIPMALSNPARALVFATVTTVGSVFGGMFGYGLGRWGGRPLLRRFFNPEKILLVQNYYHKYDIWAVGLAGFTPIPYKLFSVSAGAFQLDFKRFVLATIVGRGSRFFLVGLLILTFGAQVSDFIDRYLEYAAVAFGVMLLGGFWLINFLSKRAAAGAPPESVSEA